MKILFLTPQLPYPPQKGTTIRNYNLIKNIALRHEVHLLSFYESERELEAAKPLHDVCASVTAVMAPTRTKSQRLVSVGLSPLPDMALRLPSQEFMDKLIALLEGGSFDIMQVEGIELAQYILGLEKELKEGQIVGFGKRPTAVIFDEHNAEYVLQKRAFQTDLGIPKRWPGAIYSLIQWQKLLGYERKVCQWSAGVIAVSEADKEALLKLDRSLDITVVPNGVDCAYFEAGGSTEHKRQIVFAGTLDYRPNIDAVAWFCDKILPVVKSHIPDVRFFVVGKSPPERLTKYASPNVVFTGPVEDVRPFMAESAVYVIPMRIGGGVRFKVLEAMAAGMPVVSTSMGAEGTYAVDGMDILIADDPSTFAIRVVQLLLEPDQHSYLIERARALVKSKFDWDVVVPRLEEYYRKLAIHDKRVPLVK